MEGTREKSGAGKGWKGPAVKSRPALGIPWWSRGWDSMLPLQWAMGSICDQGTKIPQLCAATKKKKIKNRNTDYKM